MDQPGRRTRQAVSQKLRMHKSAESKSSNPSLTACVRKNFSDAQRSFSLDVEFHAAPGFTILFGPSGSGKTTLLDCVAGLATPDDGRITVDDRVLFEENAGGKNNNRGENREPVRKNVP